MFNSKSQPSKELYDTLQSTELTQKYIEQNGFNLKGLEIPKTRIQGIKINNFSLSNMSLKNYDSRNSNLANGTFKEIEFDDVYFNESTISNVTFENSTFINANFFGVTFKNVKFINCEITKSTFFKLVDSSIKFINTKIYDNEFKFSESQIQMSLIGSEFRDTDMMSLKEGSSIYVENSKINTVSFQYSKLNYFKSIDSEVTNSHFAETKIKDFVFDRSHIDFSLEGSSIDNIILIKSQIDSFGLIAAETDSIHISDCNQNAGVSLAKSIINHIDISGCNFSDLHPSKMKAHSMNIENATIYKSYFHYSNIKDLTLKNVTFIEKLNMKKLQVENATLENITKHSDLDLRDDGANIKF